MDVGYILKPFHEYISKCMDSEFVEFILKNFSVRVFGGGKWDRLTLVPKELAELIENLSESTRVLGSGTLCGWVRGKEFIPTPHLFNLSKRYGFRHGCSVVVKPQGVKAFLYGKDVLLASLHHFIPPIEKGGYIAVLDSRDMYAIGVGILLVDEDDVKKLIREGRMLDVVVKNVLDLGIHIRDESFFLH